MTRFKFAGVRKGDEGDVVVASKPQMLRHLRCMPRGGNNRRAWLGKGVERKTSARNSENNS